MNHAKPYRAKNGNMQYKPGFSELLQIIEGDNSTGFCLACAEFIPGIEPDAGKITCPCCSMPKVYGAEQLLLMGLHFDTNPANQGGRA